MNKLLARISAALLMTAALPALAGPHDRGYDRGHDRRFDGHGRPPVQYKHHQHRHHSSALGWGVAGLALGSVLFSMQVPQPAPVIVTPVPRPPGRMWYYCDSWQGYYPYVQYCPEGWRAIPAY